MSVGGLCETKVTKTGDVSLSYYNGRNGKNLFLFEEVTRTRHIEIHREFRWW